MVSKKLLTIPLCLLLLAIPITFNLNESENPFPVYDENGVWHDGPWREDLYVPPGTTPNVTTIGPPPSQHCLEETLTTLVTVETDQKIQVTIYLAIEETFLCQYYYTPYGKLNGFLYALLQIDRASQHFEEVHNVELVVVGSTTWRQDEDQDELALYEVCEEVEWYPRKDLPPKKLLSNGYIAEILVAWTSKLKYGVTEANGIALLKHMLNQKYYCACIVRYNVYWMDDNTAQHEISHLLNATDGKTVPGTEYYSDCYYADCVMSYRTRADVETIEEDGIIWTIPQSKRPIGVTWLTNNWCEDSRGEMNKGKWLYAQRDYLDDPWEDC